MKMKRLLITLALLAVVASPSTVLAGGGGYGTAFQEQWKAVQAEQKRIDAALNKIDRDAASWGVAAGSGGQTSSGQSVAPKKKVAPNK